MLITARMYMYLKLIDKQSQHADNVAMCFWLFGLEMIKLEPTTPNMSQHVVTVAKRRQHVALNNVVICCVGML